MHNPLVSIVTPSFNSMPYIEDTIKSVLTQNYNHFEHIIIDGGSTDGTVGLLKSYNHLIWISEKDNGQSQAINKGFEKAKGEIIGWLNSDDTYTSGAIEKAVDCFYDNPGVDLVFTDINIIDKAGNIIGLSKGDNFDLKRLLTYNMVKQPSLFMRRKVIEELGGLNEELHFVMDQEFWLRAGINNFKFYYLKHSIFANFRLVPGTKSFDSSTSFSMEWNRVVEEYLNHPCYDLITPFDKKKIKNQSLSNFHVSTMFRAIEDKKRLVLVCSFLKAISINPVLLTNRGIWKYLFFGLLGLNFNKLRKYQKNLKQ